MTNSPLARPLEPSWEPDVLGQCYERTSIPLGADPDGEGDIEAVLVRHRPAFPAAPSAAGPAAVLYVHGNTDYFFQRHLAEHFAEQGVVFYALDLRKCGRARRPGQTPHFIRDLAQYDTELDEALRIVRTEVDGTVLLMAHSTGGLIVPLWLNRICDRTGAAADGVAGVVLNSPWFDLQGPAYLRSFGTAAINAVGRLRSRALVPTTGGVSTYGSSISASANGQWEYNLDWKPLTGFPIRFGWLRSIRQGHAELHRGLDIGVPALILRSRLTHFAREYSPAADVADTVLDVAQIQRWAGCLGERTTIVPIDGARHDVFLSSPEPLATAFAELDMWLDWLRAHLGKTMPKEAQQ